jgi:MoaD family protein
MPVTVKFFASIREATGVDAIDVVIEQGESADALLRRLVVRFGEKLTSALYDSSRALRKDITLMVNGRNLRTLEGLDTELHDADVVLIFTSIAGG